MLIYYLQHVDPTQYHKVLNDIVLTFLSRVSILLLTRDIDIVILSVRPSVRPSVCLSVCP